MTQGDILSRGDRGELCRTGLAATAAVAACRLNTLHMALDGARCHSSKGLNSLNSNIQQSLRTGSCGKAKAKSQQNTQHGAWVTHWLGNFAEARRSSGGFGCRCLLRFPPKQVGPCPDWAHMISILHSRELCQGTCPGGSTLRRLNRPNLNTQLFRGIFWVGDEARR